MKGSRVSCTWRFCIGANIFMGVVLFCITVSAYGELKNKPMAKNYNVAMLVGELPRFEEFDLSVERPGYASEAWRWGPDASQEAFIRT